MPPRLAAVVRATDRGRIRPQDIFSWLLSVGGDIDAAVFRHCLSSSTICLPGLRFNYPDVFAPAVKMAVHLQVCRRLLETDGQAAVGVFDHRLAGMEKIAFGFCGAVKSKAIPPRCIAENAEIFAPIFLQSQNPVCG